MQLHPLRVLLAPLLRQDHYHVRPPHFALQLTATAMRSNIALGLGLQVPGVILLQVRLKGFSQSLARTLLIAWQSIRAQHRLSTGVCGSLKLGGKELLDHLVKSCGIVNISMGLVSPHITPPILRIILHRYRALARRFVWQ